MLNIPARLLDLVRWWTASWRLLLKTQSHRIRDRISLPLGRLLPFHCGFSCASWKTVRFVVWLSSPEGKHADPLSARLTTSETPARAMEDGRCCAQPERSPSRWRGARTKVTRPGSPPEYDYPQSP